MNTSSQDISVAVLGNVATGEHVLIELDRDGEPFSEADVLKARLKNFEFAGLMGFKDGAAGAKIEPRQDALRIMCNALPAFVAYLAAKLAPKGDGSEWLERLYALPDTRGADNLNK